MAKTIQTTPMRAGGIAGLPELLARLNAMPSTVARGIESGMEIATRNIQLRAQMNLPAGSGVSPQSIDTEVRQMGTLTEGVVFVAASDGERPLGEWSGMWPTFVEMGTGPHGIESGGDKYPLPASAYTQQPWVYRDDVGQFHRTSGRYAQPYLWPAYLAEQPYIPGYIETGIEAARAQEG